MLTGLLLTGYVLYGLSNILTSKVLYITESKTYTGFNTVAIDPVKLGFKSAIGFIDEELDPRYGTLDVTHTMVKTEFS